MLARGMNFKLFLPARAKETPPRPWLWNGGNSWFSRTGRKKNDDNEVRRSVGSMLLPLHSNSDGISQPGSPVTGPGLFAFNALACGVDFVLNIMIRYHRCPSPHPSIPHGLSSAISLNFHSMYPVRQDCSRQLATTEDLPSIRPTRILARSTALEFYTHPTHKQTSTPAPPKELCIYIGSNPVLNKFPNKKYRRHFQRHHVLLLYSAVCKHLRLILSRLTDQ